MKKIILLTIFIFGLILTGCGKPNPHPKNPNYKITKPKAKYKPNKKNLSKMVKELQGCPYVWAEEGPNKFDCSGYTYYMYGSMGVEIPRVARNQAKVGQKVSRKDLVYGDLVFFDTSKNRSGKITHVGMYLGNGWFTHASTKKNEVTYSRLDKPYYKSRLKVCRRYLPKEPKSKTPVWNVPNNIDVFKKEMEKNKSYIKDNKKTYIAVKDKDIKRFSVSKSRKHKLISLNGSYIQVGSFINYPDNNIIKKIEKYGLPYEIIKFPKDGKFINKLLIGPYSGKELGNKLKEIKNNISYGAFIVRID